MATTVVGTPFKKYTYTSGTLTATGITSVAGDVIVVIGADAGTGTPTCTCNVATMVSQQRQVSASNDTVQTIFTGVSSGGAVSVAFTSAGPDPGWVCIVFRGLSSATAHRASGASPSGTASPVTCSLAPAVTCTLVMGYADDNSNTWASWLLSATLGPANTTHVDSSAYLLDQVANTYNVGFNTTGGTMSHAVLTAIALPVSVGAAAQVPYFPTPLTAPMMAQ